MKLRVLASGSKGNSTLIRAGETVAIVDAGLGIRDLAERLEGAGVGPRRLDHILVSHAHLDHARSAGSLARRTGACVHATARLLEQPALKRAREMKTLTPGRAHLLQPQGNPPPGEGLEILPVAIPHDARPTMAFRLSHQGRTAVVLTDMGRVDRDVAHALRGAHVLVLEFNHDAGMLERGSDPPPLKQRIAGDGGHLSNDQAAEMLGLLVSPELHTVILAHLSQRNNTPDLAERSARAALMDAGREDVRILIASQQTGAPGLEV